MRLHLTEAARAGALDAEDLCPWQGAITQGQRCWPKVRGGGQGCKTRVRCVKPRLQGLLAKASSRGCYSRRSSRGVGFWRGFEPRLLLAAFESRRRRTLVL